MANRPARKIDYSCHFFSLLGNLLGVKYNFLGVQLKANPTDACDLYLKFHYTLFVKFNFQQYPGRDNISSFKEDGKVSFWYLCTSATESELGGEITKEKGAAHRLS